jgi:hypothetical protein
MKLINRTEFLRFPKGTLYFKCPSPWIFDNLSIKGETWKDAAGVDFEFTYSGFDTRVNEGSADLTFVLETMLKTGCSIPVDISYGRDGTYDDSETFLILEQHDLSALRAYVDQAIALLGLDD